MKARTTIAAMTAIQTLTKLVVRAALRYGIAYPDVVFGVVRAGNLKIVRAYVMSNGQIRIDFRFEAPQHAVDEETEGEL